MAAHVAIVIDTEKYAQADLIRKLRKGNRWHDVRALVPFIFGILAGMFRATVRLQVNASTPVYASETVNCDQSDTVDGTDEITIAGVTLAVEAAPANQDQFAKGADDAEFADNLAAAINAHTTLRQYVSAASDGVSDVTITARQPGVLGNLVLLAETGNGFTLGGSALSGGVGMGDHNPQTYYFGSAA